MVERIYAIKDRYIFCYKTVRMRNTKNLSMKKFWKFDFQNQHVLKHWHRNFRLISRGSWILCLYVGKFHHLPATFRLMVVKNLFQIVILQLHMILKPKICYSKLFTKNRYLKNVRYRQDPLFELRYIYISKRSNNSDMKEK